jgi:nitrite reductase/ring-hydroxylating ferredoxin subunit
VQLGQPTIDPVATSRFPTAMAPDAYHDPGRHQLERHRVFARTWQLVGAADAVAGPGAYLAVDLAGWPVVVVRDRDGALQAFHNVCRHRAGPLVDDGTGACSRFVCRYHGWAYGLDGDLVSARDFGDDALDPAALALVPVQTYPLTFQSPLARVSFKITNKIRWNAGWQFYRYREEFGLLSILRNYRAHTGYTSVQWAF